MNDDWFWSAGLFFAAWSAGGMALALAYGLAIARFRRQWRAIPSWQVPEGYTPHLFVSVLIPARNEAARLAECLSAILGQRYPADRYEVLLIDDFSTDDTVAVALTRSAGRVRVLRLADHAPAGSKKHALALGVARARGELIITTDADCLVPPGWLALFASFFEAHDPVMVAGPVNFHRERNLLQRFQSLDFLGMMLLTGAGIYSGRLELANGANLAFRRDAFLAVDGYAGVDHLASGDDVLLLRKMRARYPGRVAFLRSAGAVVRTEAAAGWPAFLRQRLRWATKNRPTAGLARLSTTTLTLALVFGLCWAILGSLLLTPLAGWPAPALALGLLLAKAAVDHGMLREAASFFRRSDLLRAFWPSQLLHVLYIALVGLLGNLVRRYEWKGRKVR